MEREPYHLLPYPEDFHATDDDDDARAEAFLALVHRIEQGNHRLVMGVGGGVGGNDTSAADWLLHHVFGESGMVNASPNHNNNTAENGGEDEEEHPHYYCEEENEVWMDEARMQALYTLVRYVLRSFVRLLVRWYIRWCFSGILRLFRALLYSSMGPVRCDTCYRFSTEERCP